MKKINALFCALAASLGSYAQDGNLVFSTPGNGYQYMVSSVSPNGKWACGALYDDSNRAFLWDLTSGKIIELCAAGGNAKANGVSDDGIVVGTFETTENTPNNVPTETYGYWTKGQWHELDRVDEKSNKTLMYEEGFATAISKDGKYIVGVGKTGETYNPVIWENGELTVIDEIEGSAFDVSDDGKTICGWTTHPLRGNRTSAVWQKGADGKFQKKHLDLNSEYAAGPFATANGISPNSRYVTAFNFVYDLQTGDTIVHDFSYALGGFQLNGVTNDGTAYGFHDESEFSGGPTMYAMEIGLDHKTVNLRDYFIKQGVNLDDFPYIQQAMSISYDEKTFALTGYDALFSPRSFIIKLGVDTMAMAPVSLEARTLEGINGRHLSWQAPLKNVKAVKGYNIYRNGEKLNSTLLATTEYTDNNLKAGEYSYEVTAVYPNAESEHSVAFVTEVKTNNYQAPRQLTAYPSNFNDARLFWQLPFSNLPTIKYCDYNDNLVGLGGDDVSFEGGIAIRAEELALYKKAGYKINQISFVPRSKQKSWTVNFYTSEKDTAPLYSEVIPANTLDYGKVNYHTLKTPLEIPEGKNLIMAINVDVTGFGGYDVLGYSPQTADAGYSDLIRQEGENEFYSLYNQAMNDPYGAYEFHARWAMGMLLTKGTETSEVKQYVVSANGQTVGTTTDNQFRVNNLADGVNKFAVVAEYTDGIASEPVLAQMNMKANADVCQPVYPTVTPASGKATVTWEAPAYTEEGIITFANDSCTGGVLPRKDQGYSYMLATLYDGARIAPFDGYEITGLRFFPTSDADFTLFLKVNDKEVVNIPVDNGSGYIKNQWNTYKLDKPVKINHNDKYMFIVDCYEVTPKEYPVGMDSQKGYPEHSDLFSTNEGKSFSSLISEGGKDANWMIGLEIKAAEKSELSVEGYNVYLNEEKQNNLPATETQTVINNLKPATYTVRVNPVYGNNVGEKVSDAVTFVIDSATGIENIANSEFEVTRNAAQIVVKGQAVSSIALYQINGALAAQSQSNQINIQSLPAGVYVMKIQAEGKTVTAKIAIK